MSIFDIIYLDSIRLASLASQRLGGISEIGSESRVVAHDASKSNEQRYGSDPASRTGGEGGTGSADVKDTVGHALQRAREIRFMDHGFLSFLESVDTDIVDLPSDKETFIREAERALDSGALVRATGSVFVDDFAWIDSSTREMASIIDLQIVFSTMGEHATLGALKELKPTSSKERQAIDELRRNQSAAIATAKAGVEAQKMVATTLADIVKRVFGDQVECGVVLGAESPRVLVRGLLNRDALREPMSKFIERYGMRSRAKFSILGTVARLGWQQQSDVGEDEPVAVMSGANEGAGVPAVEGASLRPVIREFQGKLDHVRRMIMSGGGATSAFVTPLAIYRSIPLSAKAIS